MTDKDAFQAAAILELQHQRDEFANRLTNAAGDIAVLRLALESAQKELQVLKASKE